MEKRVCECLLRGMSERDILAETKMHPNYLKTIMQYLYRFFQVPSVKVCDTRIILALRVHDQRKIYGVRCPCDL